MVEGNKNLIIADSKNASVGMIIDAETIKEKIYNIRNQKVMLDFELAEIYGYETKNFNRQIKNNIEKFEGEDFMFRLTADEFKNLRCKNFTSSWGGSRYLPYAFTEQGIYMLMTVLRGDLAVKQSRALVKDIAEIKSQMATKEDFNKVMDNFINPDSYKHFLLMDGNKIEADLAYCKIYKSAKKSIYVVDNYIGLKTLELLRFAGEGVGIVVFSDNARNKNMLTESILSDFVSDYPGVDLKFKTAGRKYHDRYVVIDYGTADEAVYVCARRPTFALKA